MRWNHLIYIIIGVFVIFIIGYTIFDNYRNSDSYSTFNDSNNLLDTINSKAEIQTDVSIFDKTLYFQRGEKELNITIWARVNGNIVDVRDNAEWTLEQIGDTWKFGLNITIPSQAVADNLQDIIFQIDSNVAIERLKRGFKHGFEILEGCSTNGVVETCQYITFDFEDIYDKALNHSTEFSYGKFGESYYIDFDVTNIEFHNGQNINLDPTITIDDVNSYNSVNNNVTTDAYPSAHITPNDTGIYEGLVVYMPFDKANNSGSDAVYSYTTNGFTGTLVGNAHTDESAGVIGGGFVVDGAGDYSKLSDDLSYMTPATNWTLMAWYKITSANKDGVIFDIYGGSTNRKGLRYASGDLYGGYYDGSYAGYHSSGNHNTDQWYPPLGVLDSPDSSPEHIRAFH